MSENMLKLTVVVPVYNIGNKLYDAFNSIKNQTIGFENIEVIFVDDFSSDNSVEIINEFKDKYSNVKAVYLDENSGFAGKPRNVGIENATTDYLMFLDPDDMFIETACETLYGNIADSSLDMVSGNYIWNHGEVIANNPWRTIKLTDGELEIKSIKEEPNLFSLPPSVWTKIFRKEFILNNDITFPEGIPGQDFVFVVDSLLKADGIKFIDEPVVNYFQGTDEDKHKSTTSSRSKKLLFGYVSAYKKALDLLKDRTDFQKYAISINLPFWVKQVSLSNIPVNDKIDVLRYARPIFVKFMELDNLNPPKQYESFFEKVVEKDYLGAVGLCEKIVLNLPENDFNLLFEVRNREIVLLNNSAENAQSIIGLAKSLVDNGYSVSVLDISPIDAFKQLKDNHPNITNCFEYYAKKNSQNPDDENYHAENCSCYTSDGFNYLLMDLKNNQYVLCDRFNNGKIYFDDANDFYDYFISEHCLKISKKAFLISPYSASYDIRDIDSALAYKIEILYDNSLEINPDELNLDALVVSGSFENADFLKTYEMDEGDVLKWESLFKKLYLNERNEYYDNQMQFENLCIENEKLKQELNEFKKVNDELLNSKSWKLTKPLRGLRKIKK